MGGAPVSEVEAAKLIAMLVTAFPDDMRWLGEQQQADTRALYRTFLLDLPYDAGDAAVRRWIATQVRLPKIAELRAAITLHVHGRRPTAGEAWGQLRGLRGHQPASALEQLDRVLHACLLAFGWITWDTISRGSEAVREWRVSRGDHEASDRSRFFELYDQLAARAAQDATAGLAAPPIRQRELVAPRRPALPAGKP